jgi:hypothetical protein
MRVCSARLGLSAMCACAIAACASRGTPPQHATTRADSRPCAADTDTDKYREMTWNEYYAQINERAWSRGIMVIWINPPQVHMAKVERATPNACR